MSNKLNIAWGQDPQGRTAELHDDTSATDAVVVNEHVFGADTDEAEIHALMHIRQTGLSFAQQLRCIYDALCRTRLTHKAQIVFLRIFLSDAASQGNAVMNLFLDDNGYPVSIIEQAPANGTDIAIWAYMKTGTTVSALPSGLYEACGKSACQVWAAGLTASAPTSKDQTALIMYRYVMMLMEQGLTLERNCQRTWFFVNDIANHYDGMIQARNEIFEVEGLTRKSHYITSTGTNGNLAEQGTLVSMDAVAYHDLPQENVHFLYAADHLNRASDYGVSIERGTSIDLADRQQVFISSTASIDCNGKVVFCGDVVRQAGRVLDNLAALLSEAGCTMGDVQKVVVYLRNLSDYDAVNRYLHSRYPSLPRLIVQASLCRPDSLIEMECMAMKKR